MRAPSSLLLVSALAVIPASAEAASIHGHVALDGAAPERAVVMMSADPACGKMWPKGKPTEQVVVASDGSLANVIVFVTAGLPKKYTPPPILHTTTIDQKGCAYVPHVAAVRVGEEVEFRNSDATVHNVNTRSAANVTFNEPMPAQNQSMLKVFSQPEVAVKLKCDIHPWMSAWIAVFDHPFYSVTSADGRFALDGLPEGDYTIEAWHETLGVRSAKIKGDDGKPATVDFSFAGN